MKDLQIQNIEFISGGQSGVDQNTLQFAVDRGIKYSGWCPFGRINENGKIPDHIHLKETNTQLCIQRTFVNARDSHGTLILNDNNNTDEGTLNSFNFCTYFDKPVFKINLDNYSDDDLNKLSKWLVEKNIFRLNISGSRESNATGIGNKTYKFWNVFYNIESV